MTIKKRFEKEEKSIGRRGGGRRGQGCKDRSGAGRGGRGVASGGKRAGADGEPNTNIIIDC